MRKPPQPSVSYTVKLPAIAQKRLFEMAKAGGYAPTQFVQLLFEAAYAARIGIERGDDPSDRDLDEQMRAVFCLAGQFNTAAIGRATGMPEALVVKILDAWREEAKAQGLPMATAKAKPSKPERTHS